MSIKVPWGTTPEVERRNRIQLSVAAFAYEVVGESIMSDAAYDALARSIRPSVATGKFNLDAFFLSKFSPDTGMWIRQHPELANIERLYYRHYQGRADVR